MVYSFNRQGIGDGSSLSCEIIGDAGGHENSETGANRRWLRVRGFWGLSNKIPCPFYTLTNEEALCTIV